METWIKVRLLRKFARMKSIATESICSSKIPHS